MLTKLYNEVNTMHKFLLSLLFQSLLILVLVFFVFQMTMDIDAAGFTLTIPFIPSILLVLVGVVNYFTFKRRGIPTKHLPNIAESEDEREQAIMNETSLKVFHGILPFVTLIGLIVIVVGFVLYSDALSVLGMKGLIRLIATTLVLMLALPGFIQTVLTILRINKVS